MDKISEVLSTDGYDGITNAVDPDGDVIPVDNKELGKESQNISGKLGYSAVEMALDEELLAAETKRVMLGFAEQYVEIAELKKKINEYRRDCPGRRDIDAKIVIASRDLDEEYAKFLGIPNSVKAKEYPRLTGLRRLIRDEYERIIKENGVTVETNQPPDTPPPEKRKPWDGLDARQRASHDY